MGGTTKQKSKQETDQTVLTITKALAKTTNCTCRAKKVEGHDQKINFFPAPLSHFQIRSGATDYIMKVGQDVHTHCLRHKAVLEGTS